MTMLGGLRRLWRNSEIDTAILAAAFQSSESPRLITGPDDAAVHANLAYLKHFACTAERAADALRARFGKDPLSAQLFERMLASAKAGNRTQAELSVEGAGGEIEWISIFANPIAEQPGYVYWSINDITARRQMEQIIADGQRKLYDFFEHAPVGFYSVDGAGRFLFVNHTFADWLESTPDEIVAGRSLHDVLAVPPPAGTPPHDPFGGATEALRGEVVFRGHNGALIEAEVSQTIERGDELRTRSVVRDIRPEREMRQALDRSERRFRSFYEDAPVGIGLLDAKGRVRECNPLFAAMAGRERATIVGKAFAELVALSDRAALTERLERIASGGESLHALDVRLAGPRERVLSLYVSRMGRDDAELGALILHALDTTDQKMLEVQFAQSQKMQAVGQLAGGIAHDFNNLLTAMIGFCDLLLLRHRPGEQSFADIMQIKQNANRAANLVRQLLAFSRQQTLQPKVLNVTDVLAELSHLLRRLIGENIELSMVHGRDLGLVRCDQGQFEQVIINMAVNARDAMVAGGTLTIRTSNLTEDQAAAHDEAMLPQGNWVLIEVSDTGTGISQEVLGRIFEPFFSTKEVGSGTGLGLSTAYGIIKQTGGFIFVDSEHGQGATFRIFLPRHKQGAEAVEAAVTRDAQKADLSGAGTVLFVEDEDPVRTFGVRALKNKGYTVLEAKTGESALEVLAATKATNTHIDLLITDVVMPKLDGPTLIKEFRLRAPDTKIICISGYAEEAFRKRLDQSSDIHFLPKPFSLNQLASKVKDVLGTRG
ncbi:MAG: PAS domain-containing protein [Alphaproteobacteria bacterium]